MTTKGNLERAALGLLALYVRGVPSGGPDFMEAVETLRDAVGKPSTATLLNLHDAERTFLDACEESMTNIDAKDFRNHTNERVEAAWKALKQARIAARGKS